MSSQLEDFKRKYSKHLPKPCDVEVLWQFEFKQPLQKAWQLISDTARYNRAVGLAPRVELESNGAKIVKDKLLWKEQEWIELPWIWVENKIIAFFRDYKKGSFRWAVNCYVLEENSKGVILKMYLGYNTINPFWKLIIRAGLSTAYKRTRKIFSAFDSSGTEALQVYNKPNNCDKKTLEKLRAIGKKLVKEGNDPECVDRLTDFICFGDELLLDRIRTKQLAQLWRVEWAELFRTAMFACKNEILIMSWDSVCPHCRGVRETNSTLFEIKKNVRCDACNTDFDIFSEESLEITFRVHPSIRQIGEPLYCVAEPAKKKHIISQTKVEGLGELGISLKLRLGTYRVRVVADSKEYLLEVGRNGASRADINLSAPATHYSVTSPLDLYFVNSSSNAVQVVVEDLAPDQLCVRPRDVFGHPEYRKLFPREILPPGLALDLGEQVIFFTDIVASTSYYEEKGDAEAFSRVRQHFVEIEKIISASGGAWVKSIGDSVMAAFPAVESAFKAALQIQEAFSPEREDSVRLRVVIHKGPCIAVNFDTGIDYFGNSVNLAAKMQSVVGACEIGISKSSRMEFGAFDTKFTERQVLCRIGNQSLEVCVLSFGAKEKVQIAS